VNEVHIERVVLEMGPMTDGEARRLAELVALELGPSIAAYGRRARSSGAPAGPSAAPAGAGVATVAGHAGERPERLAARIAQAITRATLDQVVR